MQKRVRKGSIAICGAGRKGLITSDKLVPVITKKGEKVYVWTGYHLGPSVLGKPWMSRKPVFLQQTTELQYKIITNMVKKFNQRKEENNKVNTKVTNV